MKHFLRETDEFFAQFMPTVTRRLFYLNFFVFMGAEIAALIAGQSELLLGLLGRVIFLTPSQAILQGNVWQFVTYMFSHFDFWHLFGNMLGLFFFGKYVEDRLGGRTYLGFILLAGVAAGLVHTILAFAMGRTEVGLIGFSGAVFAILTAAAIWYPRMIVYVNLLLPVQLRVLAAIYGTILLLSLIGSMRYGLFGGGVSHIAHATGVLMAVAMIKFPMILDTWDRVRFPIIDRRRAKVVRMSMGHPGRHSDPDDRYDDPHWRLDQ